MSLFLTIIIFFSLLVLIWLIILTVTISQISNQTQQKTKIDSFDQDKEDYLEQINIKLSNLSYKYHLLSQENQHFKATIDQLLQINNMQNQNLRDLEDRYNEHICKTVQQNANQEFGQVFSRIADLELRTSKLEQLNDLTIKSQDTQIQNIKEKQDISNQQIYTLLNNLSDATLINTSKQDKIINDLSQQMMDYFNKIFQDITNIQDQQKTQNDSMQNFNQSEQKLTDDISGLLSKINSITLSTDKIQKMIVYGPYISDQYWWSFSTNGGSSNIQIHPYFSSLGKIKIESKSLVSFTMNGYMLANPYVICTAMLMKDGKSINKKHVETYEYFYNSFLYIPDNWNSMNFVQEIIVEQGEYQFELGVSCIKAANVSITGAGIFIKVHSLLS